MKCSTIIQNARKQKRKLLTLAESQTILQRHKIPFVKNILVKYEEDAINAAKKIGFPVALKVVSPDITHKTEFGAVQLNLRKEAERCENFWLPCAADGGRRGSFGRRKEGFAVRTDAGVRGGRRVCRSLRRRLIPCRADNEEGREGNDRGSEGVQNFARLPRQTLRLGCAGKNPAAHIGTFGKASGHRRARHQSDFRRSEGRSRSRREDCNKLIFRYARLERSFNFRTAAYDRLDQRNLFFRNFFSHVRNCTSSRCRRDVCELVSRHRPARVEDSRLVFSCSFCNCFRSLHLHLSRHVVLRSCLLPNPLLPAEKRPLEAPRLLALYEICNLVFDSHRHAGSFCARLVA